MSVSNNFIKTHIKAEFAHISCMGEFFFYVFLTVCGIILLLIFPFAFTLDLYADVKGKKFSFALHFYDFFKVIGGYITTYEKGLALHVTKKKAILLPYAEMESQRKKFQFTECFKITQAYVFIQSGAEYLLQTLFLHRILDIFFKINSKKRELKSGLIATNGEELKICTSTHFYFNIYMLLQEFIKFLKEKIAIYARKKRKN